ncbi:MAG TPA: hypothetical protein VLH19_02795 [Patescibacteria group bacterium]|nr:hypothetical protein [Patescibacteria group bacterium]
MREGKLTLKEIEIAWKIERCLDIVVDRCKDNNTLAKKIADREKAAQYVIDAIVNPGDYPGVVVAMARDISQILTEAELFRFTEAEGSISTEEAMRIYVNALIPALFSEGVMDKVAQSLRE